MTYVVRPGDTLYIIAQRFNTTVNAILTVNPQITNPNQIVPGQIIMIPSVTYQCPLLRRGDRGPAVSRLQTLLIAARYNPGPVDGIFGPRTQAAVIAFQRNTRELEVTGVVNEDTWTALGAECQPPNVIYYTVRPGDTLYIIAARFNVSIENILRSNPQITDPNVLYPGQIIVIPRS